MMVNASLPHDPLLPQLPRALDAGAMAGVFDALLRPRGRSRVERCEVERIKYRPRRNLAVSYRLLLRDDADGAPTEQRVAARFCSGGDSARRAAKAMLRASAGLACSHEPSLDLVAHWWPHDPKLGDAARLLGDAQRLRDHALPEVVAALGGDAARRAEPRVALVQVVPEHRVTARIELSPRQGGSESGVVYAKADAERRGATTHAVMAALSRSAAAADGRLITPRTLAWQPTPGLHWQAALPGRALLDVEPLPGRASGARVGGLLAALHATPVPAGRRTSFDALRERLQGVGSTLALVQPDWTGALHDLARRLDAGCSVLRGQPNVTLHGDLHPRNVLVDGERMGLIDLDSVRCGPALLDLGDWIADYLYRALLARRGAGDALPACRAFVAAYARESGRTVDEAALAWSVACSLLLQRAWRCVVNLKPGRFALVPELLALGRALLDQRTLDAAAEPCREAA
jgi:aminoglycoside phosphotransferase